MTNPNRLFAPGDHVPLSTFVAIGESAPTESAPMVELTAKPGLLAALAEAGAVFKAAVLTGETVRYADASEVDAASGAVRFAGAGAGAGCYTLVCDAMRHDFPVVTNWRDNLNDGRGGPAPGGTDGIGVLRLNADNGTLEVELDALRDSDPANPYYYRTDALALFAGEEGGLDSRTPAYERYIGETYSTVRVAEEVAIKLSDDVLRQTGYPVVVRRPDTDADTLAGVPAFQLVHGCIVGRGEHRSMASYILPPFWSPQPEASYPVLFSGFYDQNENVFSTVGPALLKVLGEALLETGRGAIGIVWNGGGSFGARTVQGSIFENLDDVIGTAIDRFAADGEAVVTVGGSRGGIASLLAAANPDSTVYKVRYAVCYNVPLAFDASLKDMVNPTCPVLWRAICEDTGYKDAWRPGWTDPEGQTAVELFLLTLTGTSDGERIAAESSPAADRMIRALREKGTQVWMTHGTHDAFTSSWLAYRWVDLARSAGVQVRHEIGYRFGHNNCTNPFASAGECLSALLEGRDLLLDGNWYYRRADESPEAWELAERFEPERPPVYMEGPKVAVAGQQVLFNLYGEPDLAYRLTLIPEDDAQRGAPIVLMEGNLERFEGYRPQFSFAQSLQALPEALAPGMYRYELSIRRPGACAWEQPAPLAPQPGAEGRPGLEIVGELPNLADDAWLARTTKYAIGWGLSEY
ncbi:hypothetical protein ACFSR7_02700 [Cohnella sp. GCM10020058]|uniref:hypothetical protein n=1 Tax=Cohnella sp. GCM10020058 TaxID=3317330 RepID=UPI00363FEB50